MVLTPGSSHLPPPYSLRVAPPPMWTSVYLPRTGRMRSRRLMIKLALASNSLEWHFAISSISSLYSCPLRLKSSTSCSCFCTSSYNCFEQVRSNFSLYFNSLSFFISLRSFAQSLATDVILLRRTLRLWRLYTKEAPFQSRSDDE